MSVGGSHGVVRTGWGCVPLGWEGAALKVRGDPGACEDALSQLQRYLGREQMEFAEAAS